MTQIVDASRRSGYANGKRGETNRLGAKRDLIEGAYSTK